ncbi:MAG: hypothetical protein KDK45_11315 [Leptospiraceae bacterium]|nr:hypothetical protein [Leptospiraceae bacterium]
MYNWRIYIWIFILFFIACGGGSSKDPAETERVLSYILQNTDSGNPLKNACISFINVENLCILQPQTVLISCSDSELSRLKNLINPAEKRIDSVLISFFQCWKDCNTVYNTQEEFCKEKFASTEVYRKSQKSGTSNASVIWQVCEKDCNSGKKDTVKETGATFLETPF